MGVPLAYVQVRPLERMDEAPPSFTDASIQQQLVQRTVQADLSIAETMPELMLNETRLKRNGDSSTTILSGQLLMCGQEEQNSVVFLKQSNPSLEHLHWPCQCRGYAVVSRRLMTCPVSLRARVTESTVVRVIVDPDTTTGTCDDSSSASLLSSDWPKIKRQHNPETIRELSLHLNNLLQAPTWIGTSPEACAQRQQQIAQRECMRQALESHVHGVRSTTNKEYSMQNKPQQQSFPFRERALLLVHSPDHGAGKTVLVNMILRHQLHCRRVHLIRPGPLLAKYGVWADVALAAVVHEIVLAAAWERESVAIILDGLDAFLPSNDNNSARDEAAITPVLQGILSYLQQLTHSLQQQDQVPFPSAHQALLHHGNNNQGYVLPVQFCLVGIVTCADNNNSTVRKALAATRYYRLPTLTAATRQRAFQDALQQHLELSPQLQEQLPRLAAAAVEARGAAFQLVAQYCRQNCQSEDDAVVTVQLFQEALLAAVHTIGSNSCVEFLSDQDDNGKNKKLVFGHVGGNTAAKEALEDALAMDKHAMLESVGLFPPTGILLFGPPGTGKTMLARSVARLLGGSASAFVSLSAVDLVRAEVGTGEKLLVKAFETARMNAPAVVFLDEFQALFTERGGSSSGRLSSTLLGCMDDIQRWQTIRPGTQEKDQDMSSQVVVLAATNTPWMVDGSFLRPGRLDRAVHVGLPHLVDRAAILQLQLGPMKVQSTDLCGFCERLAKATAGFSGADLAALARAAAVRCLLSNSSEIKETHFWAVLEDGFGPSSDAELVVRIKRWRPK